MGAGPSLCPGTPSPARVRTLPVVTDTWRTRWLPESATNSHFPQGEAATAYGHEKRASVPAPSIRPAAEPPASVATSPASTDNHRIESEKIVDGDGLYVQMEVVAPASGANGSSTLEEAYKSPTLWDDLESCVISYHTAHVHAPGTPTHAGDGVNRHVSENGGSPELTAR